MKKNIIIIVLVLTTIASSIMSLINRIEAAKQRDIAEFAMTEAEKQKLIAEQLKMEAKEAERIANEFKDSAIVAAERAKFAQQEAERWRQRCK